MSGLPPDASFEALLRFLSRARGIDFTGYKRASLERRFRRRLSLVGCGSFGDYLDYLEVHPNEYEALFDTLLINVTEFFRDPPVWTLLEREVLPAMLAAKPADEPLRVWSAGCASGQEAYTAAIVLAEILGPAAFAARVKLYATDIDEDALDAARRAVYTSKELESVPADRRETYFEPADAGFAFRSDLRRSMIFGRNNLVADAPISRLDLVICRNTLMYLNAETQGRVLRHFHFALRERGVLVLGKSEMMASRRGFFVPLDLRKRVFTRHDRPASLQSGDVPGEGVRAVVSEDDRPARDAALELGPLPQLIVARSGELTFANLPARTLFAIGGEDIGQRFDELPISTSPADLRGPVADVLRDCRRVAVGEVRFAPARGAVRRLAVSASPLLSESTTPGAVSVVFEDVTRVSTLRDELERNRHELEQAYEELQSTIDELETMNEELQSANEELQTANEELQSTNEELEAMNEELQSTNGQLEAINDQLRERTSEVTDLNGFFEAIVTSLGIGVVVVDRGQRVQVWNRRAEDLWGVREHEAVTQHLLSLDVGLPTERLAPALRAVLAGTSEREQVDLEAVTAGGRTIACLTSVLPLVTPEGRERGVRGAILLMEDAPADGRARSTDGARADLARPRP